MYVIKKMKLNKYNPRPIVSNKELVASMGEKGATINSKETADCYDAPSIEGASKLKVLGLAEEISKSAYEKHKSAGQSADMTHKNAKDH